MSNHTRDAAGSLLAAMAMAVTTGHAAEGDLEDALTSGDPGLLLRYRYEFVDQESFADNANASTLLLRLNYETKPWRRWSGFLEFDHVFEVILRDFNSGAGTSTPARDRYPVVADPSGPDLNQLYFQYARDEQWRFRFGRQRILLDDQRYVGGVGWRQNEQTYDGASLEYGGIANTRVFYSYVSNVNRIFGTEVAAGDHRQSTHLLNANVTINKDWHAVGYAYLIDNDDAPAFSTSTFGLRAEGGVDLAGGRLKLLGELATQSDTGNNPADFDTGYFRAEGIWSLDALSAGIGIESLGSDGGQSFRTPLATLHAFNGWADIFLATPGDGLDDLYLRLGYEAAGWSLDFRYHDFSAETDGDDFGREIDFSANRRLGDRYGLLLKLAWFEADDPAYDDTTKVWVMLTARF